MRRGNAVSAHEGNVDAESGNGVNVTDGGLGSGAPSSSQQVDVTVAVGSHRAGDWG